MRKIKPKKLKKAEAEMPSTESYPHFGIDLKHLPEAKNWEVGSKYSLALELKMTGLTIEESIGADYSNASFSITGIEILKKPKADKVKRYT